MKKWYAVQYGDNFDCGFGSNNKREAVKMANALKKDSRRDGLEIRIAVCIDGTDDVIDEIIIREGERV